MRAHDMVKGQLAAGIEIDSCHQVPLSLIRSGRHHLSPHHLGGGELILRTRVRIPLKGKISVWGAMSSPLW